MNKHTIIKLAIVIPAYKSTYFEQTLQSLAKQTNKNFNLYIGDDNSPNDLKPIVDKYSSELNIKYHRFNENLGGKDLVAHWNRCIDLVGNEEFIWLFSDDDLMLKDSIQKALEFMGKDQWCSDVYHINCKIIDSQENIITRKNFFEFKGHLSPEDYIKAFLSVKDNTWGINFIARKNKIIETGKFVNFDLAWNSDHASWLKFATPLGIKNIPETYLLWRFSEINISSINDINIAKRKIQARLDFYSWLKIFMNNNGLKHKSHIVIRLINLIKAFLNDPSINFFLRIKVFSISFRNIVL